MLIKQTANSQNRYRSLRFFGATIAVLMLWAIPTVALADGTIEVTTTVDEYGGVGIAGCSLREAVQSANDDADFGGCTRTGTTPYVINVPSGNHTLLIAGDSEDENATGDLDIATSVSIVGSSANDTFIEGGLSTETSVDRIFHISGTVEVQIADVTIRNGVTEEDGNGGAIANIGGSLTISNSVITNNEASGNEPGEGGGGIFSDVDSTLLLTGTEVSNNTAIVDLGNGGGILSAGSLTINGGSIIDNEAARAGGGIEKDGGTAVFTDLTLDNNSTGINGGGLHISASGVVTMTGGSASGNVAGQEGGGLWNSGPGTLTVDTVAIFENTASGDDADQGGGGLFNDGGILTVMNSEILTNTADGTSGSGGGILTNPGGTLSVENSTIANNVSNRAGGGIEVTATMTDTAAVTLTGVDFTSNATGSSPGNGGALHITGPGEVTVSGGSAISNTASAEGGGLWNSVSGTLIISGTMISGNVASGNDADQGGGGLFNDGGVMTVSGATIMGNTADGSSGSGGGILINPGSAFTVTNSTIADNVSNRAGGGIEVNATVTDTVSAAINNVDMTNNTTGDSPGNGGALHITGPGEVMITGGTVTDNSAGAEGGGLWNSAVGTLTVEGTMISANVASGADADQGGGGLYNDGGMLAVTGSTISNNMADGASGSGGGILNNGGMLSVSGGMISGNSASRAGGGIEDNGTTMTTTVTLNDVVLDSNATGSSPGNGGALHITGAGNVTVSGGSVTNNVASAEGGGLWNSAVGMLTVTDVEIEGNTASGSDADQGGGGLFNDGGVMMVSNTTIISNTASGASGSGGGILTNPGGTLSVDNSTIANNVSNRAGGGIEVNATMTDTASVTLTSVDFTSNATGSSPGNGGALHTTGPGDVMVDGGTVMSNTASAEGGGLWNSVAGTLTISGTMISGNVASGADADQGGGGLYNDGGTLTVTGSTITDNVADGASGSGGGILNNNGMLSVASSTLTANTANRAGGGIESNVGSTALTDVNFTGNTTGDTPGNGGALHITGAGTVTATGGTVSNNSAAQEGGGFWNGSSTMVISDTIFSGNIASGEAADDGGGALYNNGGAMTVSNATIEGNAANGASGSGGGIFNNGGTVEISDSTISANESNRAGGGIEDNAGTGITITDVVLDGNTTGDSPGNGGGLHITGAGTVTVTTSTVSNNVAGAEGGGLWNSAAGTLIVDKTTLVGNTASGTAAENGGGALYNDGGTLNVSNSTVSGNSAVNAGGGFNNTGTSSVINVTFYENSGDTGAGGIANSGTLEISNSIVAHVDGTGDDCSGVTAGDFNLDSDETCQAAITADPLLGALQDNGGTTDTHILLSGSPAIDAGSNDICAAAPINNLDQRGISRPDGDTCDLGASEGGMVQPQMSLFYFPIIFSVDTTN